MGFYFCVNKTPWEYHYEKDNYMLLDDLLTTNPEQLIIDIQEKDFIKLSRKIDIASYNEVISYGTETFQQIMEVLS